MSHTTTGSATLPYPTPAASMAEMFLDRAAKTPGREAFRKPVDGGWESLTWAQTAERVKVLAAGLLAHGLTAEDRVGIIVSTRLEWVLADLAIMCAGGATTTVYPTTMADDVAYILGDSGSRIVVAEDELQVAKLYEQRDRLPEVTKVIVIDGTADGDWVITLDDLAESGRKHLLDHPDAVDAASAAVRPHHLATLIYTSGTTGRPKGVRLTHANWTYEGAAVEAIGVFQDDDIQFLWLPLAHSFGKVLIAAQVQVGFPTAIDGRVDRIVENLAAVRPTMMAGAPRIFEKVHARVVQTARSEGGVKAKIFDWAFDVGRQVSRRRQQGLEPNGGLRLRHAIADRLVFTKIRDRLGGRIRYLVSGSAALSPDVAEWFHAAGLLILEGYGLTETSAATCINRPERYRFGTVGEPFPGTEIRIAEDGEVLVRGPGVMTGYHGMPGQTADVLSPDGWFATGDIGEVDEAGRLRITDRKKDLVKTSGGKYVAPSMIEAQFKAVCPIAGQMVVHADHRNYATALVTLDPDALAQWAEASGITGLDYAGLTRDSRVRAYVAECVARLNASLNRWETVKDFRILDHDFSVEGGELTPSLKMRRRAVESMYSSVLDSMYDEPTAGQ